MKRYLEKKGFRVYMFNYSILRGGIEDGAISLQEFIRERKIKECILIGISTGAVTSYIYAQRHNGWKTVRKLISLAGPLQGTPLAYFIYFLKTGSQLVPSSEFMQQLRKDEAKHPTRIVCIHPKIDELVPARSNHIENAKKVIVNVAGHNNIHIWNRSAWQYIVRECVSTV